MNENVPESLTDRLVTGYRQYPQTHHLDSLFLPSRAKTVQLIEKLRRLMFPGFFDEQRLSATDVAQHVSRLLNEIWPLAYEQIRQTLRYDVTRKIGHEQAKACQPCDAQAEQVTQAFLDRLPEVQRLLASDVQAAFDGDPAAESTDETIFCYPGIDAIFIHRIAHELWNLKVPLLPRIMSEYAHNETGVDIHPGATIGPSFFIDHGTGVVIGETTQIGQHVKIYQGVTLGALSTKGGQQWHGRKRHPTIEDDVTIYGGAIILGGDTVIGRGATIGGSVFITMSVEPYSTVTMTPPALNVRQNPRKAKKASPPLDSPPTLPSPLPNENQLGIGKSAT